MNAPKIEYEPCIVSFIDVLGFREILITRAASEVHSVLKMLENFTRPDDEPELQSKTEPRKYSRAFATTVSDAIVRVRPYDTQYRDGAFFWELYDLLHAQTELVGNGVLIRAGVTVGDLYVGMEGEGPIFGPALTRAYDIESKEAIFPRIVIDDYAIQEHRTDKRLWREEHSLGHEVDAIDELLATGEDGIKYIDYLEASYGEREELSSHLDFLDRHAQLICYGRTNASSRRTARKYEWLARYHNRHVSHLAKIGPYKIEGILLDETCRRVDAEAMIEDLATIYFT